tara:strand:- start:1216 stop:1785 length:570 start_codon:yes stop_codon:yes gene_type:complete
MKPIFDRLVAAVGMVVAVPLFLILIPLIWLTSPGPAIFSQERVGRNRKVFNCLKLRTMHTGTKQAGTHEVSAASVTSVGKLLRAVKLDELPQLVNVLRGEMSLVGPRPCLPVQVELIEERDKRGVWAVLPGITGVGQVNGIDMSDPARLAEYDELYLSRMCFSYDLYLIWCTLKGGGIGDRVNSTEPVD